MGLYEELWTKEGNIEVNLKAAREEGMAEGERSANTKVAKTLLLKGFSNKEIAEITGLSEEEIIQISKSFSS